ncbi:MAG: acetyl-CoA carboxylase biotin carboxylase subunit [Candidatus Hydrogenedentes bacterium]|nr:acetyl-CoA carboxylase biotin carboxylase subunit [Candidatus Hydrogenedentota bacterium]
MFRRVLIANRGEIAVRIIRACRELGIASVAVHSTADHDCLHTSLADESICIGPPAPAQSYLNTPAIIAAAEICDAHAIHPGYGFLAENAKFAAVCRDCNIGFIGPSPEAIALSGDKAACRETVKAAGVPVVPGSEGIVGGSKGAADTKRAVAIAKEIGFPVLVKASAGGGGKGMRIAHNDVALQNAVSMASLEAQSAFGDGGVYIEKFVENARHIEFQILADHHGTTVAVGDRECTIQRRHQKLIEESPAPGLTTALRTKMAKAAVRAAEAIGYTNAGTAEFVLAPDGQFYFIEFNARIQVEHPVTEEVTGIDLVREQFRLATGERLQDTEVVTTGAAIEARICAEDPEHGFVPTPGLVSRCHVPGGPGIRVDSHLFSGYNIPRYYDSLIAKVIARGRTREEAIGRLAGALQEFATEGVKTTARLCARVVKSDRFQRGDIDVKLLDDFVPKGN